MTTTPPIPVGVRLPLPTKALTPGEQVELCRHALELGYRSFWVGDHVVLPSFTASTYPHRGDGTPGFRSDTPWTDPFLQLTWLAAQLPDARFGTSVLVLTLRNPTLLAKQLATMSWLTRRPFSLGVGTGWLREEYDALGMPFERRGIRAKHDIALIRQLLATGSADYTVRDKHDEPVTMSFAMLPQAPAPVEFLWGGFSPLALRVVASSCDGWLPAKQSVDALECHLVRLRSACDDAERAFSELRLVVKPGPGPDPSDGSIDKDSLIAYTELGFHEAVLEMPYETGSLAEAMGTLEHVACRSWL
jgi:alkanesulfonate monooxygenase SsuD/methylene tetrahydromethanopterin reductase-like flavin-dependent oxidoreductase (luciferase family)